MADINRLSTDQVAVIETLGETGGCTADKLPGHRFGSDTHLYRALRNLESRGIVSRLDDDRQRAAVFFLTDDGHHLYMAI